MTGYTAQGTGAKQAPQIPGLEKGNPSGSNRQVQQPRATQPTAPAAPGNPDAPVIAGGPANYTVTPQQLRDQLRQMARDGTMPVIIVPSDFVRNAVPQGVVNISIAFFVMIAFVIVGLPFARAFSRRMDSRSQRLASGVGTLAPQIEQLQQSVDAMAIELERITEAQRFQSKLMAGREQEPAKLHR